MGLESICIFKIWPVYTNRSPNDILKEPSSEAGVTDATEQYVPPCKICSHCLMHSLKLVVRVPSSQAYFVTLWFCPWTTQCLLLSWRRSHTKRPRKAQRMKEKLWRTPETNPELIDSHSSQRKASSYVDGWGLNGKKGSNFSHGLCGCQKIGFDWQLSGARLLQLLKRQPEK